MSVKHTANEIKLDRHRAGRFSCADLRAGGAALRDASERRRSSQDGDDKHAGAHDRRRQIKKTTGGGEKWTPATANAAAPCSAMQQEMWSMQGPSLVSV